jgi:hypothetical protein
VFVPDAGARRPLPPVGHDESLAESWARIDVAEDDADPSVRTNASAICLANRQARESSSVMARAVPRAPDPEVAPGGKALEAVLR